MSLMMEFKLFLLCLILFCIYANPVDKDDQYLQDVLSKIPQEGELIALTMYEYLLKLYSVISIQIILQRYD